MEKSRTIWHPTRSIIKLIVVGSILCGSLNAKELFDVSFGSSASDFDYGSVKTVSFFFPINKEIDADAMIRSLAKEKADVISTGKTSIEGKALSPDLKVYVLTTRNSEEKSTLVMIQAYVTGVATKARAASGKKYRGDIVVSEDSLVFTDMQKPDEIQNALSSHLKSLIDKITSSTSTKPKFFVVH